MKHVAEEICEANVATDSSLKKWCGAIANTQCSNCARFLCGECAPVCRVCRDACRHDKYCTDCINTHSHEAIP